MEADSLSRHHHEHKDRLVVRWHISCFIHHKHHHHHRIHSEGEFNMSVPLIPGQTAQGLWTSDRGGVLSNPSFTSSDTTVFTVSVDPANSTDGCVVTADPNATGATVTATVTA